MHRLHTMAGRPTLAPAQPRECLASHTLAPSCQHHHHHHHLPQGWSFSSQTAAAVAAAVAAAAAFSGTPRVVVTKASSISASVDADEDDLPVPGKPMRVERLLANLGYASRRDCQTMVKKGRVLGKDGARLKVGDKVLHQDLTLDGAPLDPPFPLNLMLHKPVGYVVTAPDDDKVMDPKIYDLLPHRYGMRRPFLSSIGRLDKDTSGLLLLTDDGQLVHRVKGPKQGIWKVYEARLTAPLTSKQSASAAKKFASGTFSLVGELQPLLPAALTMVDDQTARLSIMEGRYHQVRRMFATLGHEVETLHRSQIGGLCLPSDLGRGEHRTMSATDLEAVFSGPTTEEVMGHSVRPQAPGFTPSTTATDSTDTPGAQQGPSTTNKDDDLQGSGSEPGSPRSASSQEEVDVLSGSEASLQGLAAIQERSVKELSEGVKAYRVGDRRLKRQSAFRKRVATPE